MKKFSVTSLILMVLLLTVGVTYAQNPDAQRPEEDGQTIRDLNKDLGLNAENYNNMGVSYYIKGQYNQAISDYNKALMINPKYAEAYFNRGNAYYKKGKYYQAVSDYTNALHINPTFAEAYKNRGNIHFGNLGDRVKGCADWKMACDLGDCESYNLAKQKNYCP